MGNGGGLRGGVGAEPEAVGGAGDPNFGDPLAPFAATDALELVLRGRRGGGGGARAVVAAHCRGGFRREIEK